MIYIGYDGIDMSVCKIECAYILKITGIHRINSDPREKDCTSDSFTTEYQYLQSHCILSRFLTTQDLT